MLFCDAPGCDFTSPTDNGLGVHSKTCTLRITGMVEAFAKRARDEEEKEERARKRVRLEGMNSVNDAPVRYHFYLCFAYLMCIFRYPDIRALLPFTLLVGAGVSSVCPNYWMILYRQTYKTSPLT